MRQRYAVLFMVLALVGCQAPGPVIQQLPPPAAPQLPTIRPHDMTLTEPVAPARQPVASISGATVIIDPGHGGKDPGTHPPQSRLPEKAIILDIANQVSQLLRERGAKVLQTRTTDTYIENENRAALAERAHAGLFVSIHANSAPRSSVSGATVHIFEGASVQSQSQKAAQCMVAALNRAGIECLGIRPNNFLVLREHSRPAMLIECGFLSNPGEAAQLNSPGHRALLAAAIADGISAYFAQ